MKKFPQRISRKPLKRLGSDERIQGNPSFSNPLICPLSPPGEASPRESKSSATTRPPKQKRKAACASHKYMLIC
jgi:hypothetical protein